MVFQYAAWSGQLPNQKKSKFRRNMTIVFFVSPKKICPLTHYSLLKFICSIFLPFPFFSPFPVFPPLSLRPPRVFYISFVFASVFSHFSSSTSNSSPFFLSVSPSSLLFLPSVYPSVSPVSPSFPNSLNGSLVEASWFLCHQSCLEEAFHAVRPAPH